MQTLVDARTLSKRRWRCRRGLLENDLLIVNLGAQRGGTAAFDKHRGTLRWLSDDPWGRSYATPVVATGIKPTLTPEGPLPGTSSGSVT